MVFGRRVSTSPSNLNIIKANKATISCRNRIHVNYYEMCALADATQNWPFRQLSCRSHSLYTMILSVWKEKPRDLADLRLIGARCDVFETVARQLTLQSWANRPRHGTTEIETWKQLDTRQTERSRSDAAFIYIYIPTRRGSTCIRRSAKNRSRLLDGGGHDKIVPRLATPTIFCGYAFGLRWRQLLQRFLMNPTSLLTLCHSAEFVWSMT